MDGSTRQAISMPNSVRTKVAICGVHRQRSSEFQPSIIVNSVLIESMLRSFETDDG